MLPFVVLEHNIMRRNEGNIVRSVLIINVEGYRKNKRRLGGKDLLCRPQTMGRG